MTITRYSFFRDLEENRKDKNLCVDSEKLSMKKIVTEAMSMDEVSSKVLRAFMITRYSPVPVRARSH